MYITHHIYIAAMNSNSLIQMLQLTLQYQSTVFGKQPFINNRYCKKDLYINLKWTNRITNFHFIYVKTLKIHTLGNQWSRQSTLDIWVVIKLLNKKMYEFYWCNYLVYTPQSIVNTAKILIISRTKLFLARFCRQILIQNMSFHQYSNKF